MKYYGQKFPSQTDVFFWVIVLVLWGVFVAGAIGPSPILMWPITLSLFVLPARALLAWPDKEIKKYQDQKSTDGLRENGVLPYLQKTLDDLAVQVGYREPIKIIISHIPGTLRSTGSWRRHFLLLEKNIAQQLYDDLQDPSNQSQAQVVLLHEVAHFLHGDVHRVGYTRELLWSSFLVVSWWMMFLVGWLGMALLAGKALLDFDLAQVPGLDPVMEQLLEPLFAFSPEDRADIAEKLETVSLSLLLNFIINAFWNILLMAFVLWLFFWRRMLRLQEHLADSLANEAIQDPGAWINALQIYNPQSLVVTDPPIGVWKKLADYQGKYTVWWANRSFHFSERAWYKWLKNSLNSVRRWFSLHPTPSERMTYIRNPERISQDWVGIAVPALVLVLSLEILLVSPLSSYHVGIYVIHFATLAIFVILSTWVLPQIVQKQSVAKTLKKILLVVYGGRLVWIGFNFVLLISLSLLWPQVALEILNSLVFAGGRFAGNPTSLPIDNPLILTLSIIPSYLGLQVLSLGAVVLLLRIYYHLQLQVVTNQMDVNWHRRHWLWVVTLSIVVVTLLLTPLSDVLQGYSESLFQPVRLLSYTLGIGVSLFVIWQARRRI